MLTELTISNFAIIERQALTFHPAFNVISGETGAGKSIILHALEFILGAKISPTMIRAGADQIEVQALFDLTDLPDEIRSELPEIATGDELVVSRTLPREGRGKILVNGRLATLAMLEEIVRRLVNICSQHHHTRLLDARFHLELLDGFCGHEDRAREMRDAHRAWIEKRNLLVKLTAEQAKGTARREELQELLDELVTIEGLRPGRRAELDAEIKRLGSAERLISAGQRGLAALNGEDGVSERLKDVSAAIQELCRLDPDAEPIATAFEAAREAVSASEEQLDRYMSEIETDDERLEALRTELSALARLERKYRADDAGLCKMKSDAELELSRLAGPDGLRELEREVQTLEKVARRIAGDLSESRIRAGKELARLVAGDLAELNMADARLDVHREAAELGPSGFDRFEFLIATNKGEQPKALVDVASGGELSRVMLVLKKILRERSGVNVLIFDEVDTGVSGGVARSVGRMLKEISMQSQVICITHLPQVASLSDRHFLVNKQVSDRAVTVVRQLSDDEKVDEIARMLAGYTITEASRASARELIGSKST